MRRMRLRYCKKCQSEDCVCVKRKPARKPRRYVDVNDAYLERSEYNQDVSAILENLRKGERDYGNV